jgi:hypothetical protein
MIDIDKVISTASYLSGSDRLEEVTKHIGVNLTQKEAKKVVGRVVEGIGNIVRFSPPLRSFSDHRLRLISMKNKLENAPEDYLTERRGEGMVNGGYNKIYALLKQDEKKVAKVMKWELPVPQEKLAAVAEIARATTDYCLVRIGQDLDRAALEKATKKLGKAPMEAILEGRESDSDSDSTERKATSWVRKVSSGSNSTASLSSDGSVKK